jgi:hypothetical protein
VSLSGAGSRDPEGEGLTYAWDFGDGTTGSGPAVSHRYAAGVGYPVRLTVTDPLGAAHTSERTVEARDRTTSAPPAALARLSLPRSGLRVSSRGVLSLKLTNPGALTSIGDLKLTTATRVRIGSARARRVTLGDAAFILAPRANRTVRLKLSKSGRKLVAKLRKVPVVVTWRAQERGGSRTGSGRASAKVLAPKRRR